MLANTYQSPISVMAATAVFAYSAARPAGIAAEYASLFRPTERTAFRDDGVVDGSDAEATTRGQHLISPRNCP